jgi:iron-sulfur cluster repair protein YtfE (RIC family)
MNAVGVDTCCGGARSLDEAAAHAGIAIDDLLFAINAGCTTNRDAGAKFP